MSSMAGEGVRMTNWGAWEGSRGEMGRMGRVDRIDSDREGVAVRCGPVALRNHAVTLLVALLAF